MDINENIGNDKQITGKFSGNTDKLQNYSYLCCKMPLNDQTWLLVDAKTLTLCPVVQYAYISFYFSIDFMTGNYRIIAEKGAFAYTI